MRLQDIGFLPCFLENPGQLKAAPVDPGFDRPFRDAGDFGRFFVAFAVDFLKKDGQADVGRELIEALPEDSPPFAAEKIRLGVAVGGRG